MEQHHSPMEQHRKNAKQSTPAAAQKKLSTDRVFGANALELSEREASKLVGGIVEKGIASDNFPTPPSSAPRLTVLPFPAARHRSHGPHWSPIDNRSPVTVDGGDDDVNDEGDNDPTNYDPVAQFANPITKKKKKGMDLSRWRELVPSSRVSNTHDKEKSLKTGAGSQKINVESMRIADEKRACNDSSRDIPCKDDSPSVSAVTEPISSATMGLNIFTNSPSDGNAFETLGSLDGQYGKVKGDSNVDMGIGQNSLGSVEGNMSVEGQIDAENRALLEKMSPEEIVEAQTDIRNRLNPGLLQILKNRGLQKLKKMNSKSGSGADNVLALSDTLSDKHVKEGEKKSPGTESNIAPQGITPSLQNAAKRPDESVVQNLVSIGGNSWDGWSKQVEAVRNLRFSLDGHVIEGSSLGQTYSVDSVGERDFLRTDGDPGAAGYTVREALALTRSVVPGQRALALHLLASVLSKALHNICKGRLGYPTTVSNENTERDCASSISNDNSICWEAVWAYALGPEPELVLSLRMTLDDNHNSVVLASAKVIQCILSCDLNEYFFNRLEKIALKSLYTAPVFRSRPDIKHGFLGGGFWKYSAKPSNILPIDMEVMSSQDDGEPTIQDDNVVAEQDVVAGLVRMGILPRLCYLLEADPVLSLEDCILSILIAIARHSPSCAHAIWKCERLIETIVRRFTGKDSPELHASKIKSVTLLRVLSQSSKSICIGFIDAEFFQVMTWQLHRVTSFDEWVKSGREVCKLASELMVEQLRFWRVCIMYGCCISYFSGIFPALCLWLNPPTFEKLIEKDVFHEFASISLEAYLVLETLARRLPDLYSLKDTYLPVQGRCLDNVETWCWNDSCPMVDMALKWMEVVMDASSSKFFQHENGVKRKFEFPTACASLLWILSAILRMLHIVLIKATPKDVLELKEFSNNGNRLSEFVAKITVHIFRIGILNSADKVESESFGIDSFIEKLCHFRHHSDSEVSAASIWCLHGLLQVIISIDHLIQLLKNKPEQICFQGYELLRESEVLDDGVLKYSFVQWKTVVSELIKLVPSEWHFVHDIEVFSRGGPSPGVGVGWGASGGGFWSPAVTLAQADATLLVELLETFYSSPAIDFTGVEENTFVNQTINSALASSLIARPGNEIIIQKVIDMLLQTRVLEYLHQCIFHLPCCNHRQELFKWEYTETDLMQFSKLLTSHFTNRWLSVKKKKKKNSSKENVVKKRGTLDTIHEEVEPLTVTREDSNCLTVEWAHLRLPLPSHWLLSPISTIGDVTSSDTPKSLAEILSVSGSSVLEVVKAGLFFLLGIETISSKLFDENVSVIRRIPLSWKLHSLSVALLLGMGVLEDERSRGVFEALQNLYGQQLDELSVKSNRAVVCKGQTVPERDRCRSGCLRFQSEVHESYSTFIETLVEQFAAVSYGDLIYARQIATYLHHQVEDSVRLATWNALSNARVLELLPPLGDCLPQAEGYLEPIEEDDAILEAYVKSWVSGSLDKAATRGSMTYTIVVQHLSSFIFKNHIGERLLLRNKLVKSLLRDYSRKQMHEGMLLELIQYNYSSVVEKPGCDTACSRREYLDERLEILKEACEDNSQLLSIIKELRCSFLKQFN